MSDASETRALGMMKAASYMLPCISLILVGGGIAYQWQALTALESEQAFLKTSIAARLVVGVDTQSSHATRTDPEVVDWKRLCLQISEISGQRVVSDRRPFERFVRQLKTMSEPELIAALADISKLDIPTRSSKPLDMILFRELIDRDPELGFKYFSDYLHATQQGMGQEFSDEFRKWAKGDLAKASEWLDRQITLRIFGDEPLSGKNISRSQYEAILLSKWFSADLGNAFRRLDEIPQKQRADVMSACALSPIQPDQEQAFIKLARNKMTEDELTRIITHQSAMLVTQDSLSEVSGFLGRISATSAERAACAEQVGIARVQMISRRRKVVRDDLDVLRTWFMEQAPDAVDKNTGAAIAALTESHAKVEFAEAHELALHYYESSGNDDVLTAFLKSNAALSNKGQARLLAEKIRDSETRAQMLQIIK